MGKGKDSRDPVFKTDAERNAAVYKSLQSPGNSFVISDKDGVRTIMPDHDSAISYFEDHNTFFKIQIDEGCILIFLQRTATSIKPKFIQLYKINFLMCAAIGTEYTSPHRMTFYQKESYENHGQNVLSNYLDLVKSYFESLYNIYRGHTNYSFIKISEDQWQYILPFWEVSQSKEYNVILEALKSNSMKDDGNIPDEVKKNAFQ
jgi:hypothetical protein